MRTEINYNFAIQMLTMVIIGRGIRLGKRETRRHCKYMIEIIASCFDLSNNTVLNDMKREYLERAGKSLNFSPYKGHGWD